jgi:His-Xaa-Ser system radical SAM maturase HxsC
MAAIALSAKVAPMDSDGRLILRLTTDPHISADERSQSAFLLNDAGDQDEQIEDFPLVISVGKTFPGAVELPTDYGYLANGDIIRLAQKTGDLRVLYRKNSRHNVLFITEQCNSRCVMCSQPPRDIDDDYLIEEILKTIPMMSWQTSQLCITGGEPTLNFQGLLQIITSVKKNLPSTSLHMLSNGRSFKHTAHAKDITSVKHPDFMIGIPLYSDQPSQHDFVVQSKGAFDETILGLLNLAAFQQKIEIRFVIHQLTVSRMVATAKFIARNLPFASHVALMGLEPTGFGRTNLEALWIDPWDYREELAEAIDILRGAGIRVSIYNHQLCILPQRLWGVASQSISDWKNIFVRECDECSVGPRCAGFFSSSRAHFSKHIHAIKVPQAG